MSIPKVAGIETEYGIVLRGTSGADPFLASRLLLTAFRQVGKIAVPYVYSYRYSGVPAEYTYPSGTGEVPGRTRKPGGGPHSAWPTQTPGHGTDIHYEAWNHYGPLDWMLMNGARLYIDHAHPEYSTPECLSPRLLVAADKAGEVILDRCCQWAHQHGLVPKSQGIFVYKNNTDYKGHSYGCHENYLVDTKMFESLLYRRTHWVFRYLLPFLVTRIIFCGAGKVGSENGTPAVGFQLSQRADFFETLMGLQTSYQRPLFNTRDEPHADPVRFRRLHVILGDANMSEFSTFLKIGTTQLVLRMLEDRFITGDFTLADPVEALQTVSRDLSFQQPLSLENGEEMTALEIQQAYLALARQYWEQSGGSEEELAVLREWEFVLSALQTDWRQLITRYDWAIKKNLLDQYLFARSTNWDEILAWQPVVEATLDVEVGRLASDAPGTVLDDLRIKDPKRAAWIEQYMWEKGLLWDHYLQQRGFYFGLRRLDLEYHNISQGPDEGDMGLFYRLQSHGLVDRLLTDDEIEQLTREPPPDTRAWLRGNCVARFASLIISADWDQVRFRGSGPGYPPESWLELADPLAGTREAITSWGEISQIEQVLAYAVHPQRTVWSRGDGGTEETS